jgi:hypothetical protein
MGLVTHNVKTWRKLEDGTMELVSDENIQVEELTKEELVAEKEAQLLAMYNELEALKSKQNG